MKAYHKIFIILSILLILSGVSDANQKHLIAGQTMGTTYHVTVVSDRAEELSGLKAKIERRLLEINQVFSTYIKDSEISRFNALTRANEKFQVSDDLMRVMRVAQEIYRLSEGAWDGTVNPLVDLWSFGPTQREPRLPPAESIKSLLTKIGFKYIQIVEPNLLVKSLASVTLDLNAIAKGYAVDEVARLVAANGIKNYLVEIGGEVFVKGLRPDGQLWQVGINRPQKEAAFNKIYKVVSLSNQAFATSGDYRNFFEIDGVRYSHVIDPRTGYPVSNGVVSASIIAGNCTFADGLATAIMVMGAEKGLDLVNRLENVECFIVVERSKGFLTNLKSKGFKAKNYP
jgi:thiamine biosynthesis lipoprotein